MTFLRRPWMILFFLPAVLMAGKSNSGPFFEDLLARPKFLASRLPGADRLTQRDIDFGGWVQWGYTINGDMPDNKYNGPNGFNTRANQGHVNQLYFYAGRPAQLGIDEVNLGFRADLMFGIDAPYVQVPGLDDSWETSELYGWAMPQLYADVAYGDVSVKIGHFYTIVGYEAVQAPDNFFYSHAYTSFNSEPFTHTGVLATWAANDEVTVYGGWTLGWDSGFDDGESAVIGGVSADLSSGRRFSVGAFIGREKVSDFSDRKGTRGLLTATFEAPFRERFTSATHALIGVQEDATSDSDGRWYGLTQVFTAKITDDLSAGVRGEVVRDEHGFISSSGRPVRNVFDDVAGVWSSLTLSARFQPVPNVFVRPEVRFDWFHNSGAGSAKPYDNGDSLNQSLFGIDAILTY